MKEKKIIIITGGPGIGKTTTLNKIADRSYTVIPEAARMIIDEEQRVGSDCLPWINLSRFQIKVAKRILELEHSFDDSILFGDRGLVDGHGYCKNGKIATPDIITDNGFGRYPFVCFLQPLSTYQKDSARKESPLEARRIHRSLWSGYLDFNYSPLSIPVLPPVERAEYILNSVERFL